MNALFLSLYPDLVLRGHELRDPGYRRELNWVIWLDRFNAGRLHQHLLEETQ